MLSIVDVNRLYLGIQGENGARTITIDVAPWLVGHPGASISIWHKRNGDATPSATGAVFDADAGTISWTQTGTDTYVAGEGVAEIRLTEDSVIKKSRAVITGVSPSVTGAGVPLGSDWQSYINEVDRIKSLAVAAKTAAETAQGKAEDAQEAAEESLRTMETTIEEATEQATEQAIAEATQTAENSAKDAEAYATGKRGGVDVESTDPAHNNNSKYYMEKSGENAEEAKTKIDALERDIKTGAQTESVYHLGLYIDDDGDICQEEGE